MLDTSILINLVTQIPSSVAETTENAMTPGMSTFFQILVTSISQSGLFGKFILVILFIFSIISWGIMFERWRYFKRQNRLAKQFLTEVWSKRTPTLNLGMIPDRNDGCYAQIYRKACQEIHLSTPSSNIQGVATTSAYTLTIQQVERSLENVISEESTLFEKNLSFLGTTASATPFIGLLGTVWGILSTFYQMGLTGTANFTTIAPGLAESLIATAAGLAAAIPAVIAYNHFLTKVRRETGKLYHFASEILNLVEQQYIRAK